MGILKQGNDQLWKILLSTFGQLSDNVYFILLLITTVYALATYWIIKKTKRKGVVLLTDSLFFLSVRYMIIRLPMIHKRIRLALGTCSGIILQSKTYLDSFQSASNTDYSGSASIAEYLYFLKDQSVLKNCEPVDMYKHLFSTLNSALKAPVFGTVYDTNGIQLNLLTILVLIVILWICLTKKDTLTDIFWIFLLAASLFISNGVVFMMIARVLVGRICIPAADNLLRKIFIERNLPYSINAKRNLAK